MTNDSSIVIVSYRPGAWLMPSIESALGQASEVVVVDNGSPDAEVSRIARAAGARIVRSPRNQGFAGGVMIGMGVAGGDIVGVLNDDATAGENWIAAAADVLRDPSVAAVTPKVVLSARFAEVTLDDEPWHAPGDARPLGRRVHSITVNGNEVLRDALGAGIHQLEGDPGDGIFRWTAGGCRPFYVPVAEGSSSLHVTVDGEEVSAGPLVRLLNHAGTFLREHGIAGDYGRGTPDDGRFDVQRERFGFSGTAPVFLADTWRRIGPFAERFFAYNEDTDWSLRARLAGMRVVYDPRATVVHRLSATSGGPDNAFVRHLAQRNSLLCLLRNAPLPVARRHLVGRLRLGPFDGVSRSVYSNLPWALATRASMARRWVTSPRQIWDAWAERDCEWDSSPWRTS